MSDMSTGRLILTEVPEGAGREALLNYLAKSQRSLSRDRLSEMVGTLPLVLSRSIPDDSARRIVAELEKLGAKLDFRPNGAQQKQAESPRPVPEEPARPLGERLLNDAFASKTIRFPIAPSYRVGLMLVSVAMILLSLTYVALIAGTAYLLYWHATANLHVLTTTRSVRKGFAIYVAPLVLGGILLLFLVKPIFARRAGPQRFIEVFPGEEPLLFAFIRKVCEAVGAPMPGSVRLDTQVNASAGFGEGIRSLFRRDLVLTLGLPLAGGLSISEFAGVLAHEFGHFAQSSGMRLSYLIRSINYWFARVVYEEDVWDVRLRVWSRTLGQFGLAFWLARFLIWLVRKVLFVLMKAGHLISCFMLRQMEFDADRYEAALVGGDVFESTCVKLGHLSVAQSRAFEDLDRLWEEAKLADSLPELVTLHADRMEHETKAEIARSRAAVRTKPFDTHPADTDRIHSARAVSCTPVFVWGDASSPGEESMSGNGGATAFVDCQIPSATVLFRDFQAISRKVTREHYRQVLGRMPDSKNLVDVRSLLQSRGREERCLEALERYFLGRFNPWIPLGMEHRRLEAPADPTDAVRSLNELRERILRADFRHEELAREYVHVSELMDKAAGAMALLDAGFKIDPRAFCLAGGTVGDVMEAEKRYVERERSALEGIAEINRIYLDRLMIGLDLLQGASGAGWTDEHEQLRAEVGTFLRVMEALEFQFPLFRKLHLGFVVLATLTHQIPKNEDSEQLMAAIQDGMTAVRQDLRFLRERLGQSPYPFDHVRADTTLGQFLIESDIEDCGLGELLGRAEAALDRMPRTYCRLAARLVWLAEEMEHAHGLKPFK
ncbi:MAG: M48 family metallopeptidase [Syntrophobacteraceae bacterium]